MLCLCQFLLQFLSLLFCVRQHFNQTFVSQDVIFGLFQLFKDLGFALSQDFLVMCVLLQQAVALVFQLRLLYLHYFGNHLLTQSL